MAEHEKINYIEFPSRDFAKTKAFFSEVFGWTFEEYGDEYLAFLGAGLDGGFYLSDMVADSSIGGTLVVFYSERLEETKGKIEHAGGKIIRPIFSFPGGRRFHFADTNGNEYAVWSDLGL